MQLWNTGAVKQSSAGALGHCGDGTGMRGRMGAGLQGVGLGLGRLWRPGYVDVERLVVGRIEPADTAVLFPWVRSLVSVPAAVSAPWAKFVATLRIIQAHATVIDCGVDLEEVSVRLHGGILSGSMKRPTPATLTAAGVFEDYWMHEMGYRGLGSGSGGGASTLREWP